MIFQNQNKVMEINVEFQIPKGVGYKKRIKRNNRMPKRMRKRAQRKHPLHSFRDDIVN